MSSSQNLKLFRMLSTFAERQSPACSLRYQIRRLLISEVIFSWNGIKLDWLHLRQGVRFLGENCARWISLVCTQTIAPKPIPFRTDFYRTIRQFTVKEFRYIAKMLHQSSKVSRREMLASSTIVSSSHFNSYSAFEKYDYVSQCFLSFCPVHEVFRAVAVRDHQS